MTTVLLVEDNPGDARLTKEMLLERNAEEIQLLQADRLSMAFDQLRGQRVDAVLLDLSLPDSQGLSTFQKTAAQAPNVPIIVLSGLTDESVAFQAVQQGAQDYLVKNKITGEALHRVIRYAIERKRLEQRYRTLVANIPGAVYRATASPNRQMIFLSDAIEAITVQTPTDLLRGPFHSFDSMIHPDDQETVRLEITASISARAPYQLEYRIVDARGELRWISDHGRGVFNTDGTLESLDGMIFDITATKRTQEQLRRREEQLRRAQKMEAVGGLATGLAHNFNNLLTAINGYSDLMLARMGPEHPLRADAEQIKKAAGRAGALTQQLKAFSHSRSLDPRILDLNLVIGEIEEMIRWVTGGTIELNVLQDPMLGRIKADLGQVEQILLLLIANSKDAMPKGGQLTIVTENVELGVDDVMHLNMFLPGPYVLLTIKDTGEVAEEEVRRRIQDKSGVDSGLERGWGLATVSELIAQCGGYLDVRSNHDRGVTYRIYFPQVDVPMEVLESHPAPESSTKGNETLLLVEDEEMIRTLTRQSLERQGYRVLEASAGPAALRIGENYPGPIHLLIADAVMPGMSGGEVAQELLKERPGVKVLFMSGYPGDAITHRGVLTASSQLLSKPFTTEDLIRRVRELLDVSAGVEPNR